MVSRTVVSRTVPTGACRRKDHRLLRADHRVQGGRRYVTGGVPAGSAIRTIDSHRFPLSERHSALFTCRVGMPTGNSYESTRLEACNNSIS